MQDMPWHELMELCALRYHQRGSPWKTRRESLHQLHNIQEWTSARWYAPRAPIVEQMWQSCPMPDDLREIAFQLVSAPDKVGAEGQRILADTQDTMNESLKFHDYASWQAYGMVTAAPYGMRQGEITHSFLREQYSGNYTLETICAHHAGPASVTMSDREYTNWLWELRKARRRRGSS
jgi:hypothetical protein